MCLANWADADGFVKAIRIDYLGESTECSRSVVFQRLRELEAGGALARERGHHADGRTVSATLRLDGEFRPADHPPLAENPKNEFRRPGLCGHILAIEKFQTDSLPDYQRPSAAQKAG